MMDEFKVFVKIFYTRAADWSAGVVSDLPKLAKYAINFAKSHFFLGLVKFVALLILLLIKTLTLQKKIFHFHSAFFCKNDRLIAQLQNFILGLLLISLSIFVSGFTMFSLSFFI